MIPARSTRTYLSWKFEYIHCVSEMTILIYCKSRVHVSVFRGNRKPYIFLWKFTLRNAGIGSGSNPAFHKLKNEWLPVVTKRRRYNIIIIKKSPFRDNPKPLIFQWAFTLRNAGIEPDLIPAFLSVNARVLSRNFCLGGAGGGSSGVGTARDARLVGPENFEFRRDAI